MRLTKIAVVFTGLLGISITGCQGDLSTEAEGTPPPVAHQQTKPGMSAMGARAHTATLATERVLRRKPDGAGDAADDDQPGGPGALDDALPGGGQAETSIAVDDSGQHIVVGFNDFRGFSKTPISVSGFMYSDDGGHTFHDGGQLPASTTPGAALPQVFGDPDIKYLGNCTFIYTSIVVAPFGATSTVQTMGFHRSFDCGHTWEGPFVIASASNPSGVVNAGSPQDAADKEFIDVDRSTGRVLMSWTNFGATPEISTTYSDNVLSATPTFSPRVVIGNRPEDGQGSMPRFGVDGTAYVAWGTFFDTGNNGISVARSTDGGATFSAPIDLVRGGFAPIDQILGNDRVHSFPAVAVDKSWTQHRGDVYVAYAQNDARDGADVVVQTSADRGASFRAPVFVTSRPGHDRSQWFPALTNNDLFGRVLVTYYDQGVASSGDLSQTSYTYSDDGGTGWAQARRLSPRTFHAGWGNDSSQPNLGDYQQGVVTRVGTLLDAYAITHPVGFRDGEPTAASFSVPEPIVSIKNVFDQLPITSVDLQGVSISELGPSNHNGFFDAGETVKAKLTIRNYVTNPLNAATIHNAFAAVSTSTPGAHVLLGLTTFPTLGAGETKSSGFPVLLSLDSSFVTGGDVALSITVFSTTGLPTTLEGTVHTGTPVETTLVTETFDGVAPGTLPATWRATHGAGANVVPWTTRTGFCGSASNGAFHVNADDGAPGNQARWERLLGPSFAVPADADYVTVDFDVCTDTEDDPSQHIQAFDGVFLRVFDGTTGDIARSVLVEAFEQEFTTGDQQGYPKHFPRNSNKSYFEDMSAWAGDSGGLRHVHLRLPGMAAATAQLRFEFAQDDVGTCADVRPGHACGVLIDNVVVKSVKAHR